ncbi:MAG: stage IV sporulation protein A, partial [Ruthenibacterium sp.]
VAFSLYYVISNILSFVQSVILKKMYDPEKIKAQVAAEIAERRVAKKQKKQITVKSDDGKEVVKDVTEAELARLRLARARELDAQRYED